MSFAQDRADQKHAIVNYYLLMVLVQSLIFKYFAMNIIRHVYNL